MSINKICVVGLGYIGLPTAALLANRGFEVHGVDVVPHVVDTINKGNIHIVEPELDTFVHSAVKSGKLKADLLPTEADVFVIAVPTPFLEGFVPDISYVISATEAIAPFLKDGNLIILESTSPIGTTHKIEQFLNEAGVDTSKIYIAHCPERVLPGHVMKELIENDRIVGGINEESTNVVAAFYEQFVSGQVLKTDAKTAEMCKLVENSYRDTNIAFANELSMICDEANINVWKLIELANKHPRVNILTPGSGVGGHCIAVDPWFIVSDFPKQARLIKTSREVNNYKSEWVIEKIKNSALQYELNNGKKPIIACLGLAFKPNIDDMREAPALKIYEKLLNEFPDVKAVEPNVEKYKSIIFTSLEEAVQSADIIALLVGHKQFINLSFNKNQIVHDFCGIIK